MGIVQTALRRVATALAQHLPPPTGADLPGSATATTGPDLHDIEVGHHLARTARSTEQLIVLDPANEPHWQQQVAMLRTLANVYYRQCGLYLPGPDPAQAFPAVQPLLHAMTGADDRHEQAALLTQIRDLLSTTGQHDPALAAIAVLARTLPPAAAASSVPTQARAERSTPTPSLGGARPSGSPWTTTPPVIRSPRVASAAFPRLDCTTPPLPHVVGSSVAAAPQRRTAASHR
ncbi:hypothetical protein [Actinoplanes regularis]|uniref:hypothetical protein n=1 Tax=Actinoplanes regularis TaxID=52697 RepID=UPI0024A54D71|nr:hypothetical protein [Actinoplanes regularis]GLW34464.1 hypothetical protein Areg01_74010 [Actinoplanes regularis]